MEWLACCSPELEMAESFATNKRRAAGHTIYPDHANHRLCLLSAHWLQVLKRILLLAGSDGTYTATRHRIRAIENLPLGKISRKYLGEVLIWQVLESIQRCRVLGECNGKISAKVCSDASARVDSHLPIWKNSTGWEISELGQVCLRQTPAFGWVSEF